MVWLGKKRKGGFEVVEGMRKDLGKGLWSLDGLLVGGKVLWG